jgi:hypothetical protein
MRELSPEAKKIHDARKAAVEELKAIDGEDRALTNPDVIRLSNARLYEAAVTLRVLTGERIPASEIKAADEMVQAARNAVPKKIDVNVYIVGAPAKCPQCGLELTETKQTLEEARDATAARIAKESAARSEKLAVPRPSAPRSITDVVPGAAGISQLKPQPLNVVELKRDPGSIHNAQVTVPDGNGGSVVLRPPLKRLEPREPWQGYPLPTV